MKRLLIASLVAVIGGFSFAETNSVPTGKVRKMTPELRALLKDASYRAFGGQVRKPGSARGAVAFLNAQKRIPSAEIHKAVNTIDERVHVVCKYADVDAVNVANPRDEIARLDCALGVAVVDDAKLPALLVAPEDGWAVVNVAPLAESADAAKSASRVRKEVMRAFALAGGCSFMCRGAEVLRETARPVELDDIRFEEYGIDALNHLTLSLPTRGVTPWHQTTYRKACKEGWAANPTNDVQKAIWDKVHALPSDPIKIKYDPKRDK